MQEIEKFYSDLYKADSLKPSENLLNSFLAKAEIPILGNPGATSRDDAIFSGESLLNC